MGSRPYGHEPSPTSRRPCRHLARRIATAAAQQHLRTSSPRRLHVLGQPEVFVQMREGLIDDDGNISDPSTVKFLTGFLEKFEAWIGRFAKGG